MQSSQSSTLTDARSDPRPQLPHRRRRRARGRVLAQALRVRPHAQGPRRVLHRGVRRCPLGRPDDARRELGLEPDPAPHRVEEPARQGREDGGHRASLLPFSYFSPSQNGDDEERPADDEHLQNVRKGVVSDLSGESVLQPLLVSSSAIELATETVGLLLRIGTSALSPCTLSCSGLRLVLGHARALVLEKKAPSRSGCLRTSPLTLLSRTLARSQMTTTLRELPSFFLRARLGLASRPRDWLSPASASLTQSLLARRR